MVAESENIERQRNKASCAEYHVEISPGFFNEQVWTQNELTNNVEGSATNTGHSVGQTKEETELFLEPATEYASCNQPEKGDLSKAQEYASDVPLPNSGELRHCEESARCTENSDTTDDTYVELLKQSTNDW